jgi:uncharacterized protein (TIGR02611 family)
LQNAYVKILTPGQRHLGHYEETMKLQRVVRKIAVVVIGLPLLVLGIILIPLPGPGILVCLLALFILSLEFEWPRPYLKKARTEAGKLLEMARARQRHIEAKLDNDKDTPQK